jgi:hypothetical protein
MGAASSVMYAVQTLEAADQMAEKAPKPACPSRREVADVANLLMPWIQV